MKSLQDNYNLIKEGKGSRELFLKQAKRQFPQYITNVNTFDQATANLKTRGIITETISKDVTSKNTEPNWFKIFNKNLTEAKATETKTSKEVKDLEEKNFDYKDTSNADNLIGGEILTGFYAEMKDPKNADKTVEEVKAMKWNDEAAIVAGPSKYKTLTRSGKRKRALSEHRDIKILAKLILGYGFTMMT